MDKFLCSIERQEIEMLANGQSVDANNKKENRKEKKK